MGVPEYAGRAVESMDGSLSRANNVHGPRMRTRVIKAALKVWLRSACARVAAYFRFKGAAVLCSDFL
jgi:hypothetical protein